MHGGLLLRAVRQFRSRDLRMGFVLPEALPPNCANPYPYSEERVLEKRGNHRVELNGWANLAVAGDLGYRW